MKPMQITQGVAILLSIGKQQIGNSVGGTVFDNGLFQPGRVCDEEEQLVIFIADEESHLANGVSGQLHSKDRSIAEQVISFHKGSVFVRQMDWPGNIHRRGTFVEVTWDETRQEGLRDSSRSTREADVLIGVWKIDEARAVEVRQRGDVIRMEVRNEDVGNVPGLKVEG